MNLKLNHVFENPGASEAFNGQLGAADDLPGAVAAAGNVINKSGLVELTAHVSFPYSGACDRCAEVFAREFSFDFFHILVMALQGEDSGEFILVPGGVLDLDQLIRADILLHLPSKILCKPACMGLCPRCGGNLNQAACGCADTAIDSPFKGL